MADNQWVTGVALQGTNISYSHQTGKGQSSTQKCRLGIGDVIVPRGFVAPIREVITPTMTGPTLWGEAQGNLLIQKEIQIPNKLTSNFLVLQ